MSNRKNKPFIVKHEKALRALPHWIRGCGHCNTMSHGDGRVSVGYDTNPEGDYGGNYTPRGHIIVVNDDLYEKAIAVTRETVFGKATP